MGPRRKRIREIKTSALSGQQVPKHWTHKSTAAVDNFDWAGAVRKYAVGVSLMRQAGKKLASAFADIKKAHVLFDSVDVPDAWKWNRYRQAIDYIEQWQERLGYAIGATKKSTGWMEQYLGNFKRKNPRK